MSVQIIGSGIGYFTLADTNGQQNDYQKGSVRPIIRGINVGLAEVGSEYIVEIVHPIPFDEWLDPLAVPYPDIPTLLADLQANIFQMIGGVPEAPIDGNLYGRRGGAWVDIDDLNNNFIINTGHRSNTLNAVVDLEGPGRTPTSQSPFVAPFNGVFNFMAGSAGNVGTWDADILINGVSQYTLNIVASQTGNSGPIAIPFVQGDLIRIQFSPNSGPMQRPHINLNGRTLT